MEFYHRYSGKLLWVILLVPILHSSLLAGDMMGIAAGFVRSEESSLYVDDPVDSWIDRETGLLFTAQYYKEFSRTFFLGGYGEYEKIDLEGSAGDGSRFGFGLSWMGRTAPGAPGKLFLEFGGFGGYAIASLGDLESYSGFDFGIFLGPVYQASEKVQIALHAADMYGWYNGDEPEGVQNVQPRFRIQVYLLR